MQNIQKVCFEEGFSFQSNAFILPEPLMENSILNDRNNSGSSQILNTKKNSLFPQNLLFHCNMRKLYLGFSTGRDDGGG